MTPGSGSDAHGQESGPGRLTYLDWLRGLAVLIMIAAHTADAWTEPSSRNAISRGILVVGGIGAPLFLFLAGITLTLGASRRTRRGASRSQAGGRAIRHGATLFALAFLLQFQSWVVSGGDFFRKMLRVEILHVMGLAMIAASAVWLLSGSSRMRVFWLAAAAAALAMATPVVRASALVAMLPDPVEWYLVPIPGRSTFTLLPWAGFLLAGGAIGQMLEGVPRAAEARAHQLLLGAGLLLVFLGYGASMLPPLYADASFWTTSPTFFVIRVGILIAAVPVARWWLIRRAGSGPVVELGLSSLFVYWVHLELVYGRPASVLHERLTPGAHLAAFALFSLAMLLLARAVALRRNSFLAAQVALRQSLERRWPRRRQQRPADFRPETS